MRTTLPISDRVRKGMAESSWIRRMFEQGILLKQKHGTANVFDLTLGNPIFEPPPRFTSELKRLTENPTPGMHRYMENAGYPETRAAVARQLASEFSIPFTANDIIMTCGAAAALNVGLKSLILPGDEVIIFAPYFAEYFHYITNHYGTPRVVPCDNDFLPRLDALEAAINPRTKALIINSPNNPTGAVYPDDFLAKLGGLLQHRERKLGQPIYLFSDEPYRRLIYDGLKFASPLRHHAQGIIVNSHSKDLALPGERIGYIALHPECQDHDELFDGMVYLNRTLGFVNAPALMQRAVRGIQEVTVSITQYRRKRDFLYNNLVEMGYKLHKPQGAFYMFPRTPIPDDVDFVRDLQSHLVLVVPGEGFGTPGHFRISYCVDDYTIEGCLDGLRKTAHKFGLC